MNDAGIEQKLMDLERRVDRIEQILPTLLTRDEFENTIGRLSGQIRQHLDVVAESLRGEIRLLAEGHSYLVGRLDGVDQRLDGIDLRLDRVDRRLDSIDLRLDSVDRRLDSIDLRLDSVDRRLDGIDLRLDGVDRRLDGIDQRLDGMDRQLGKIDDRGL